MTQHKIIYTTKYYIKRTEREMCPCVDFDKLNTKFYFKNSLYNCGVNAFKNEIESLVKDSNLKLIVAVPIRNKKRFIKDLKESFFLRKRKKDRMVKDLPNLDYPEYKAQYIHRLCENVFKIRTDSYLGKNNKEVFVDAYYQALLNPIWKYTGNQFLCKKANYNKFRFCFKNTAKSDFISSIITSQLLILPIPYLIREEAFENAFTKTIIKEEQFWL